MRDLVDYAKALGKESTAKLTFRDMWFYHKYQQTGKLYTEK